MRDINCDATQTCCSVAQSRTANKNDDEKALRLQRRDNSHEKTYTEKQTSKTEAGEGEVCIGEGYDL
jgi:hypothetical protein